MLARFQTTLANGLHNKVASVMLANLNSFTLATELATLTTGLHSVIISQMLAGLAIVLFIHMKLAVCLFVCSSYSASF